MADLTADMIEAGAKALWECSLADEPGAPMWHKADPNDQADIRTCVRAVANTILPSYLDRLGQEIHDFAKQTAKTDTADAIIGLLTAKAIVTGTRHPDMDSFASEIDEVLAAHEDGPLTAAEEAAVASFGDGLRQGISELHGSQALAHSYVPGVCGDYCYNSQCKAGLDHDRCTAQCVSQAR